MQVDTRDVWFDTKLFFQLPFRFGDHLTVFSDGHMLRCIVMTCLPHHHQLQAVITLLLGKRYTVRPFSGFNGHNKTLINFRRQGFKHGFKLLFHDYPWVSSPC
ncbi:Hypothetical Protein PANA_2108 [Pantoea ananatis LMG 20103]|uniref:Uncharacterized protein n=1 Tax=Pantoea ananatis (strain LMG 20103) TaxID=706191 RepID=D4GG24_PANAM|nr:Hypothetical Protein PANA_2108 [Pantoea ananatis LMG 20103]